MVSKNPQALAEQTKGVHTNRFVIFNQKGLAERLPKLFSLKGCPNKGFEILNLLDPAFQPC